MKQEIENLRRLIEDLQNSVSEMTGDETSKEREQAKELDRLHAL
jgi:hypothetical protein